MVVVVARADRTDREPVTIQGILIVWPREAGMAGFVVKVAVQQRIPSVDYLTGSAEMRLSF